MTETREQRIARLTAELEAAQAETEEALSAESEAAEELIQEEIAQEEEVTEAAQDIAETVADTIEQAAESAAPEGVDDDDVAERVVAILADRYGLTAVPTENVEVIATDPASDTPTAAVIVPESDHWMKRRRWRR